MDPLLSVKAISGVWLTVLTLFAIRKVAQRRADALCLMIPVHYVFCGIPLILVVLIGEPSLTHFPGLAAAAHHDLTNYVYCGYVSACPVFWLIFSRVLAIPAASGLNGRGSLHNRTSRQTNLALSMLWLTPFLVLFSPDPSVYLSYTPFARDLYTRIESQQYHMFVSKACLLAIIAGGMVIEGLPRLLPGLLLNVLPLIAICWI